MRIREAVLGDKEQILALLNELLCAVEGEKDESTNNQSLIFNSAIKRNHILIFVVEESREIIGMAELQVTPNIRRGYLGGMLENFIVSGKWRGKGVGTKLLDYIIYYCKRNKIKALKVKTGTHLIDAHKFYEKHGGKFTEKVYRLI